MDETLPTKLRRKTIADYKTAAEELLTAMILLEEQMDSDHANSERLKIETQVIKAETLVIKARAEATLTQLQEQVNHLTGAI